MTEQTPEVTPTATTGSLQITPAPPSVTAPAVATTPPPDPKSAEDDWQQRFEAQQKVNRDLERKLNDLRGGVAKAFGLEDGEKPEPDNIAHRVNAIQERLDKAERESKQLRAAAEHDIPKNYHHLLTATDDETLAVQAAAIGELVKGRQTGAPAPDPTQGAQPTSAEAAAEAEYEAFAQHLNIPIRK